MADFLCSVEEPDTEGMSCTKGIVLHVNTRINVIKYYSALKKMTNKKISNKSEKT